jgi:hypothetical protein
VQTISAHERWQISGAEEKLTWSGCIPTTSEQSASRAEWAGSSHSAGPNSAWRWAACAGCCAPSRRSAARCALLSFAGRGSIVVHLQRRLSHLIVHEHFMSVVSSMLAKEQGLGLRLKLESKAHSLHLMPSTALSSKETAPRPPAMSSTPLPLLRRSLSRRRGAADNDVPFFVSTTVHRSR